MTRLASSARRIAPLAWPVFIGQMAVLAFSTVDTTAPPTTRTAALRIDQAPADESAFDDLRVARLTRQGAAREAIAGMSQSQQARQ